ncbi:SdiA-regulated domain-containing protein [Tabrizicola sp. DMG-N-6]|uniref:SdiA-regulated domain-containing protein n=1 Tax=Szabonella alba TaxID=2804194 RepID=A0A8K0V997_9RHOB|nr:SdiA-regulated domain-containing protein [Szabonella alba]MBL4915740.1 SdiA-regulated domain-containing protein [Szabonella alba]
MTRRWLPSRRLAFWLILGAAVLAFAAVSVRIRVLPWMWYSARTTISPMPEGDSTIGLSRYRAASPRGLPIAGISGNLSGLTFVAETGTLFASINRPPEVVELSTGGQILRRLPVSGGRDVEGITHVEGNRFVLSDEGTQTLHWVEIGPSDTEIDLTDAAQLHLGIDAFHNMGFEGVSWDAVGRRLLVVQEMLPLRVLEITGIDEALAGKRFDISVRELRGSNEMRLFMRDLSSLTLHERTGHLLLLSEMSAMIVEYDHDAEPVGTLDLGPAVPGLPNGSRRPRALRWDPKAKSTSCPNRTCFTGWTVTRSPHGGCRTDGRVRRGEPPEQGGDRARRDGQNDKYRHPRARGRLPIDCRKIAL